MNIYRTVLHHDSADVYETRIKLIVSDEACQEDSQYMKIVHSQEDYKTAGLLSTIDQMHQSLLVS